MRAGQCFIILTFILGIVTAQSSNECSTPNHENGVCINIKRCSELLTLLENQRHVPSVLTFLKKSFCGFEGKITKVCCPLEIKVTPITPNVAESIDTAYNDSMMLSSKLPSQTTCGISNVINNRIFGGNPAELGDWPWMAVLGYQGSNRNNRAVQWLCGGTLVSKTHVLTAAHCVHNLKNAKLTLVRLGELDLNDTVADGASPLDVPIERIIAHPKYSDTELTSDIALLKLKNSVTFNEFIQPICLPSNSNTKDIDMSRGLPFVAGWGTTQPTPNFRVSPTTTLMEVQVPLINTSECKIAYSKEKTLIDDRVLCAGYPAGGKDSCRGDSGGPLMWPKGKQFVLLGIVSYGYKKCGEPGYPGVYTKVLSFMDWVVENISEN